MRILCLMAIFGCATGFLGPQDRVEQEAEKLKLAPHSLDNRLSESLRDRDYSMTQAIEQRSLFLGMTMREVILVWGEPSRVEAAGDPALGHEKWVYLEDGSDRRLSRKGRLVYFHGGLVSGWRTFLGERPGLSRKE
jgi:hypothetical protein